MIIEIDDNKTLEEISKAFTERFPFLKIEFYDSPHRWQEGSGLKHLLPQYKKISEVRTRHNPGAMEIRAGQKTGSVEQEFHKRFGLNVQIFRHHGDRWIQSVGTDDFTLEEQNETGKNACEDSMHGTNRNLTRNKAI